MTDQKAYDETAKLNNGRKIPILGLGTSLNYGEDLRKSIDIALKNGYRAFDTAYLYRNEVAIGEELNSWFESGRLKREDVFVTTKLPMFGNRSEDVSKYMKKSLKQLNLDYVDLYLIHHPFGVKEDPLESSSPEEVKVDYDTDLMKVWKAMEEQVDAGLTKAIGLSNFNIDQIDRIKKIARIQPSCLQVEVHVYFQQKKLLDDCKKRNLQVIAYAPISAPYSTQGKPRSLLTDAKVVEIAKSIDKTPCQVVLKFLVQKGVCIIPKSHIFKEIEENCQLNFTLSSDDMNLLEDLDRGKEGRIFSFSAEYEGVGDHKEFPFH